MPLKNISSLTKFIANAILLTGFLSLNHSFSQEKSSEKIDGGALFKSKCSSCHQPHKNGTGPKLYNARSKWSEGGAKENSIYLWVNNWQQAAAVDPYAMGVSQVMPTAMNAFPELSKNQIDAILNWVDEQPDPSMASTGGGGNVGQGGEPTEEESNAMIWILFGVAFIIIILSAGGVRRQLSLSVKDKDGSDKGEDNISYLQELKIFLWKYRLQTGICSAIILIALIVTLFKGLYSIGVVENYQPSQPIEFPHSVHAGENGIDCKYCHNSVTKSKSAGLPTVNVCMNCHKQINGNEDKQVEQISKIYSAAGFNPEKLVYDQETHPIVWNKVHSLPDHVYFNHSQHVVVGGIDCKQCHGDMTKMTQTAKIQPVSELNKVEGNIKLTRPTLTMGWCIECHDKKEISNGPISNKKDGYYDEIHKRLLNNDKKLYKNYLKDNKVTVKELGGWECGKCHY
jgi:mono/diheme cytochrome c family protein